MDKNGDKISYMYEVSILCFTKNFVGDIVLLKNNLSDFMFSVFVSRGYSDQITFSPPKDFSNAKLASIEFVKEKSVKEVFQLLEK